MLVRLVWSCAGGVARVSRAVLQLLPAAPGAWRASGRGRHGDSSRPGPSISLFGDDAFRRPGRRPAVVPATARPVLPVCRGRVPSIDPWRAAGGGGQAPRGAGSRVPGLLLATMESPACRGEGVRALISALGPRAPATEEGPDLCPARPPDRRLLPSPVRLSACPPTEDGPAPAGAIVITTADSLQDVLGLDFSTAHSELAEARSRRAGKDTPDNRLAVAEARARIDAVLDMYVAAGCLRR